MRKKQNFSKIKWYQIGLIKESLIPVLYIFTHPSLSLYHYEFNKQKVKDLNRKSFVLGMGIKYRSTELGDVTGSGYTADLGLKVSILKFQWTASLSSIPFLNGKMSYSNNSTELFASQLSTGIVLDLRSLQPMVQYEYMLNSDRDGLIQIGLKWSPFNNSILSLLGGYRQIYDLDNVLERITMGLYLNLGSIQLSYAYEQSDRDIYNNANYFSLGLKL